MTKFKKSVSLILLVITILGLFSACENDAEKRFETLADLNDGTIAILTGSVWDGIAKKEYSQFERKYYSSVPDIFLSLEQGKIDAIFADRSIYISAKWKEIPIDALDESIGFISCGFMMPKEKYDPVLLEEINAFIAKSKEDGTIDRLSKKWCSDTEPDYSPEYHSLTGNRGVIKVAVDSTLRPMTYQKSDLYTGFDVEFLTEFARQYGYTLDINGMTFDALIPSVSSAKYDIVAGGFAITEERAENVTFTDPYFDIDGVVIVKDFHAVKEDAGFFAEIRDNFEKTFIEEDRWKLIADSVLVTLCISVMSIIAGSLFSLGLFLLSRTDIGWLRTVVRGIVRVYSRIIAGTPVVVILMILYYVVFGSVRNASGIFVAIFGFTLTFGAFVYEHMTTSVGSVDKGQTEAAYALGYTKNRAFFRIILPQAMKVFMPSYCAQTVDLVKATAVVGYIAVNDVTKIGDIIRSNTYEPFFPLIATALIYFLITWVFSLLLGIVGRRFDTKRRSDKEVLKGVTTK